MESVVKSLGRARVKIEGLGSYVVEEVEYRRGEYQTIETFGTPMVPDPKWRWVDANRHSHRWGGDRIHTTVPLGGGVYKHTTAVKRRVRPVDYWPGYDYDYVNEDPPWTDVAWNCRECGALITPGMMPDPNPPKEIQVTPDFWVLDIVTDEELDVYLCKYGPVSAELRSTAGNRFLVGQLYAPNDGVTVFRRAESPPEHRYKCMFITEENK